MQFVGGGKKTQEVQLLSNIIILFILIHFIKQSQMHSNSKGESHHYEIDSIQIDTRKYFRNRKDDRYRKILRTEKQPKCLYDEKRII